MPEIHNIEPVSNITSKKSRLTDKHSQLVTINQACSDNYSQNITVST